MTMKTQLGRKLKQRPYMAPLDIDYVSLVYIIPNPLIISPNFLTH